MPVADSRNVHRLQFLEQQFRGVRDVDLGNLRRVAADGTVEFLFLQIGNGHETTLRRVRAIARSKGKGRRKKERQMRQSPASEAVATKDEY